MEKRIKIMMNDDKNIVLFLNDEEKHTIDHRLREVSAEQLYDLLDFHIDDTYIIETQNDKEIDQPVITFFSKLISEITESLMKYNFPTELENE